jgi:hypothetical protein
MATPILLGIIWSGDKDDGGATTTADVPAAAAPPAEPKAAAGLKRARPADTAAPGAATGDGGLQWRAAALKRAMAESERTKRSLEDCVRERWGSVRELTGGQPPEAFLRAADAAARRAPRPRGRGRGRGRAAPAPPAERAPKVRLHGEQTDADLLRSYSQKLETQFGAAMKGVKGLKGARPAAPAAPAAPQSSADRAGGDGWVGISARTTLGGGSSSFDRGWRRRGGDGDAPPPAPRDAPAPARPPADDRPAGSSNSGAAEALRRRLGK